MRYVILLICFFALAPSLLLAEAKEGPQLSHGVEYSSDVDVSAYLVSEKLDGVRAYWDGARLLSRNGNEFIAPSWFTKGFPERPLDGELWIGRGTFEEVVGTVRKQVPMDDEWRRVRYMLFELPEAAGTFSKRYEQMMMLVEKVGSPYLQVIEQKTIESHEALDKMLAETVAGGGEGLMLHRADALYSVGRSDDIMKVKQFYDAEARVIDHLPGKGKYTGMLGAIVVETEDGIRFRIGTGFSDEERKTPPPIGSTITYKYYGLTAKGIPKFASFLRMREPL